MSLLVFALKYSTNIELPDFLQFWLSPRMNNNFFGQKKEKYCIYFVKSFFECFESYNLHNSQTIWPGLDYIFFYKIYLADILAELRAESCVGTSSESARDDARCSARNSFLNTGEALNNKNIKNWPWPWATHQHANMWNSWLFGDLNKLVLKDYKLGE